MDGGEISEKAPMGAYWDTYKGHPFKNAREQLLSSVASFISLCGN